MPTNYIAPGVTISETPVNSVAPLIATPDDICLIGYAAEVQNISMRPKSFGEIDFIDLNVPADSTNFDIVKVFAKNPLNAGSASNLVNGAYVSTSGYTKPTTPPSPAPAEGESYYHTGGDYSIFYDEGGLLSDNKSKYLQRNIETVGNLTQSVAADYTDSDGDIYVEIDSDKSALTLASGQIQLGSTSDDVVEIISYEEAERVNKEVQLVTLAGVTSGTYTLKYGSAGTATDTIAFDASASAFAAALNATGILPTGASVSVTRSGSSGSYAYNVTFNGTLAGVNATALIVGTAPGAGSVTITTPTAGGSADSSTGNGGVYKLTKFKRGQGNTQAGAHNANSDVSRARTTNVGADKIGVPVNTVVGITWQYTPKNHWDPQVYSSYSDIVAKFGKPYTEDEKAVNSSITLAASIAINNGAQRIWIQPLFKLDGTVPTQPTDPSPDEADWVATLNKLNDIENLGVVVPVVGQSAAITNNDMSVILSHCQNFVAGQLEENQSYVILIAGEDGTYSTNAGQPDTLQTHAQSLDEDQLAVLVSPSIFKTLTPSANSINIGGQYAAAAVAGRLVSFSASKNLTRKAITGFTAVDPRSKADKNLDAQSGLLVLEDTGTNIQIRHALTAAAGADAPSASRSELSVVRAKQKLVASLLNTIDTQLIGQIVADGSAELVVESTIRSVLQTLVDDREIVGFSNVTATTKSYNPTIIAVSFNYRPAFPVNYIEINFAVDITNGSLINTTTTAGA